MSIVAHSLRSGPRWNFSDAPVSKSYEWFNRYLSTDLRGSCVVKLGQFPLLKAQVATRSPGGPPPPHTHTHSVCTSSNPSWNTMCTGYMFDSSTWHIKCPEGIVWVKMPPIRGEIAPTLPVAPSCQVSTAYPTNHSTDILQVTCVGQFVGNLLHNIIDEDGGAFRTWYIAKPTLVFCGSSSSLYIMSIFSYTSVFISHNLGPVIGPVIQTFPPVSDLSLALA
jgi:hypothetical protein